jgi:hypothetical protein
MTYMPKVMTSSNFLIASLPIKQGKKVRRKLSSMLKKLRAKTTKKTLILLKLNKLKEMPRRNLRKTISRRRPASQRRRSQWI